VQIGMQHLPHCVPVTVGDGIKRSSRDLIHGGILPDHLPRPPNGVRLRGFVPGPLRVAAGLIVRGQPRLGVPLTPSSPAGACGMAGRGLPPYRAPGPGVAIQVAEDIRCSLVTK